MITIQYWTPSGICVDLTIRDLQINVLIDSFCSSQIAISGEILFLYSRGRGQGDWEQHFPKKDVVTLWQELMAETCQIFIHIAAISAVHIGVRWRD